MILPRVCLNLVSAPRVKAIKASATSRNKAKDAIFGQQKYDVSSSIILFLRSAPKNYHYLLSANNYNQRTTYKYN